MRINPLSGPVHPRQFSAEEIQALVLDLDGTLLTDEKAIGPRTFRALQLLRERGLKLVIASGRTYGTAKAYTESLNISEPYVLANGALVVESQTGKVLLSHTLDWDVCRTSITLGRQAGLHIHLFADRLYYEVDDPRERQLDPLCFEQGKQVNFDEIFFPELTKLLLVGDENTSRQVLEELHRRFPGGLYAVRSAPGYYEVMNSRANKAAGIREVAQMLSIPISRFLAIGDAENDTEMLSQAGIAAAMGNGMTGVKEIADYVLGTNNEDAIGVFLEEFFKLRGT
jgi:Cof subfamily protein (haloacid dehalogenase superfamily)